MEKWYLLSSETSLASVPISPASAKWKINGWRDRKEVNEWAGWKAMQKTFSTFVLYRQTYCMFLCLQPIKKCRPRVGKNKSGVLAFQRWVIDGILSDSLRWDRDKQTRYTETDKAERGWIDRNIAGQKHQTRLLMQADYLCCFTQSLFSDPRWGGLQSENTDHHGCEDPPWIRIKYAT